MTCLDGLPCFCKDGTTLGHLPSMHVDADDLGLGICPTPMVCLLCILPLSLLGNVHPSVHLCWT